MPRRTAAPPEERPVSDVRMLRWLRPFLWPRDDPGLKLRLAGAVFLLIVMAGINALVPILFAQAVDAFTETEQAVLAAPIALLLLYGFLHWGGKLASEARWLFYGPIEQRVQRRVGLAAFRHLHGLSLGFHLDRSTGRLARILDNGLRAIRELLFDCVFLVLPFVTEIVLITSIVVYRYEGWYAAIMLVVLVAYLAALIVGASLWRKRQRVAIAEGAVAHGKAIDSLLNYETVKYFGNDEASAARYDSALKSVERLVVRSLRWRAAIGMVLATIIGAGLAAMVLLAGSEVIAGTLTVGDFVLVNAYLLQIIRPLERMSNIYRRLKAELTNLELLVALFDEETEVKDAPGARNLPKGPGAVSFEGVSFSYRRREPILDGISFDVSAGGSLAIVGPTGAGKSTIARLLFRSYDPTTGTVRIDGQDLHTLTQTSVRDAIGVVPQEPVLFNESIGFNIGFGRPGADRADIEAAARAAEIHDFIAALPDGYDTLVGERGLKLSGGEKQRVAIARVVLKNPPILIFDEATSSLDTRTEAQIQENLHALGRGRTRIVVAHRLSTVVDADEILFLAGGHIAERGTHEALLAANGAYAALWRRQHKKDGEEEAPDGDTQLKARA